MAPHWKVGQRRGSLPPLSPLLTSLAPRISQHEKGWFWPSELMVQVGRKALQQQEFVYTPNQNTPENKYANPIISHTLGQAEDQKKQLSLERMDNGRVRNV